MKRTRSTSIELPVPKIEVPMDSRGYLDATFAACEQLAKTHYENFIIGSKVLPKHLKKHFYSIYSFARGVDDLGDEIEGDRLALLDLWAKELNSCYASNIDASPPTHPYFVALTETIKQFNIPVEPFERLIEANRRDQSITRYETFDDLTKYCALSANPVGQLVLYLSKITDPNLLKLSDKICTGLQLTNFCQDVGTDIVLGRIYIPLEDLRVFEVTEKQIKAFEHNENFENLMRFQVNRAREFLLQGYPLLKHLDDQFKLDFALFVRGGLEVLRLIENKNYKIFTRRVRISKFHSAQIFFFTWLRFKLNKKLVPEKLFDPDNQDTSY